MRRCSMAMVILLSVFSATANVRLPKIFSDNMVLQRNQAIPIWGWADPNERITVQFGKQTKKAKADKNGRWSVRLEQEAAGGPYTLTVKGKNAISYNNVLVGDVWICSGQSNMEWTVQNSADAAKEIASANFPQIRHFKVPRTVNPKPQDDITGGQWEEANPQNVDEFTAVGYFFARELHNKLKVPIGLINTSWGGTHVETWTSRHAFEESDEFKEMIAGMPSINFDSLAKVRKEANLKRMADLKTSITTSVDTAQWKLASFDHQSWTKMKLPGLWEQRGLENVDGVVWFRKVVNLSADDASKPAVIELGKIDDSDHSYVNGVFVGGLKDKYNDDRRYNIPAGVLKEGPNVILVRVEDTGGGGGINGEQGNIKLTTGTTIHPLHGDWSYKIESLRTSEANAIGPNDYPTLLFNAMINPLVPYAIKGAIWYQGESNAGRAYQYRRAFPLMITDWRKSWGYDFPFLFVQLASFVAGDANGSQGSTWAELREAQTMTLSLPNTGMAVTTDIGEAHDIHPRNKQDVGKRLAASALYKVYGEDIVYSGPTYASMKKEGDKIILSFNEKGSGLVAKDKYGYLKGFEIAGADKQFKYAKAHIENNQVVVYQDGVTEPVAVRFAWADNPEDANLFNQEGFPAVPFRTDDWKGITEQSKFSFVK